MGLPGFLFSITSSIKISGHLWKGLTAVSCLVALVVPHKNKSVRVLMFGIFANVLIIKNKTNHTYSSNYIICAIFCQRIVGSFSFFILFSEASMLHQVTFGRSIFKSPQRYSVRFWPGHSGTFTVLCKSRKLFNLVIEPLLQSVVQVFFSGTGFLHGCLCTFLYLHFRHLW